MCRPATKPAPAGARTTVRRRSQSERGEGELPEVLSKGQPPKGVAEAAKETPHRADLMDARYQYRYDVKDYEGVGMAAFLPPAEYFSLRRAPATCATQCPHVPMHQAHNARLCHSSVCART